MPEILIDIRNKTPAVVGECRSIVADNTDYTIHFTFDDDWTSLSKTVLFVLSDGYTFAPVETENNFVTVPKIVTDKQIAYLFVGVRQGDVITTRPCSIPVQESISTKIKDDAVQPDPSMWEDVISRLEKLEQSGGTGGNISDAVQYIPQTLTDDQKAQARENIGAQIADFIVTFSRGITEQDLSSDKTFAEVKAAYDAGATIRAVCMSALYELYSTGGGEGFGFVHRDPTILEYDMIWLWEDDFVTGIFNQTIPSPVTSVNGKTGDVTVGITAYGNGDAIVITTTQGGRNGRFL